ncbi:MAG: ATP-binding cassette domain-containing protein [Holosporales bacterium]|jgi:ABC-2 type transport system ATP-binding protein|nr:ATP-binding cassette domain-containing protein [Holosporales bacterium]
MIEISKISKTFCDGKITALDEVSLQIPNNKIVGIIGPDGAGKTTLLRIMAGILTPSSGCISIDGRNIDIYESGDSSMISIHTLSQMISYMPQRFGLYEDLSVIENLELYAQLHGIHGEAKSDAFARALQLTRLECFQDRLAGNLSGGMKQKLGLACAILKKPQILILDEPSVGVDPISRIELIAMVNTMLSENTTVLWSTAYLDEAEELDHVVLLNCGKTIFDGAPQDAIKDVVGRVFMFTGINAQKRSFASEVLKEDGILDSVIVGQSVKVLTDGSPIADMHKGVQLRFGEVTAPLCTSPKFEDACINILGGMKEKESPLIDFMRNVQFTGNRAVVEAERLTKRFGTFIAVDGISFSVKCGKIFGLLGPNGSGKSTTFKMLCGLIRQDSGSARINGIDVADMGSDAKKNIGYMAQKFSLYPTLSVRQNLEFAAGAYGLSGQHRRNTIRKMLDMFHLDKLHNINASALSLGFKQRLALACAIMHSPPVLFLDEPTSGVDPITRKEFWLHINAMVMHGVSVVITTHFMDEAENCDEIAMIYKGKIRAVGSPDEIKAACTDVPEPTLNHAFIKIVSDVDREAG